MGESSHLRFFRSEHVHQGEEVLDSIPGYTGELFSDELTNGELIVTNRRVAFVRKGLTGNDSTTTLRTSAQFVRRLGELRSAPTAAAPASGADPICDRWDELAKIGDLHERGLLSDEQFAKEKTRLMGSSKPATDSPAPAKEKASTRKAPPSPEFRCPPFQAELDALMPWRAPPQVTHARDIRRERRGEERGLPDAYVPNWSRADLSPKTDQRTRVGDRGRQFRPVAGGTRDRFLR